MSRLNSRLTLGIVGVSGRMGQALQELLHEKNEWDLVLGVSQTKIDQVKRWEKNFQNLEKIDLDVLIDFSLPEISIEAMGWASQWGVPVVSGTTGFNEEQWQQVRRYSDKTRILWSANMSLGVAVLKKALETLSSVSDFDFQIQESHHKFKKDSPSGTALMLQERLEKIVGKTLPPVLAARGGGVLGEHQVLALGQTESLCFSHKAVDRKVFAQGAIKAAGWIVSQKQNGLYSFDDMLT